MGNIVATKERQLESLIIYSSQLKPSVFPTQDRRHFQEANCKDCRELSAHLQLTHLHLPHRQMSGMIDSWPMEWVTSPWPGQEFSLAGQFPSVSCQFWKLAGAELGILIECKIKISSGKKRMQRECKCGLIGFQLMGEAAKVAFK